MDAFPISETSMHTFLWMYKNIDIIFSEKGHCYQLHPGCVTLG